MKTNYRLALAGVVVASTLLCNVGVAAEKLDDATIFAIFDEANTVDIWTGRLGAQSGNSEEVRALGRMVASDHEAVQQMGRDLAKKLGIVPTPPKGDLTAKTHAETVTMLAGKTGPEFDRAYLIHEINFHQGVIDAIKGTLLPSIKNAEFKKMVNTVLPGFEHHLETTKVVAKKLGIAK